jgi:general secretion pathway protein D
LVRESKVNSAEKIPVLGDLPVLGFLFRSTKDKMRKTNLLLVLTPHVIRDQSDLKKVFERKMQERQEYLDRYFVFSSKWEPPRDYTRTSGLVEVIRQNIVEVEERERLEDDVQSGEERTHEATVPLELAAGVKSGSAGGESRPKRRPKVEVNGPTGGKAPRRGGKPRSDNAPLLIEPPTRSIAVRSESRASSETALRVE